MKVIDLINMKYNNEEMPEHIIINRMHYKYDTDADVYIDENKFIMKIDFTNNVLNMPVEIIEETEEIEIQELSEMINPQNWTATSMDIVNIVKNVNTVTRTVNQITRVIKQINNKIKKKELDKNE